MSNKKELSAIDAIYNILDKIENIEKRIDLIDSNIKLLNNKMSNMTLKGVPTAERVIKNVAPEAHLEDKEVDRLVLGNIKTFGYIANKGMKPIEGVSVSVYDDENKIIKKVYSNVDGYWEVRLPCGDYGVEYVHKKFKPINKVISLGEGMTKYEVR